MSFAGKESSRQEGQPISLYRFKYGPNPENYYAYTNGEGVINFDGHIYVPRAINNSDIIASGNLDKTSLNINCSRDLEIVSTIGAYSSHRTALTIHQGHWGDADFRLAWVGRVLGRTLNDREAILNCEPASSALSRMGLRRNWQMRCPHPLYGPGCFADRERVSSTHVVAGVTGSRIALPEGWNEHASKALYFGGVVEWTTLSGRTELRTIMKVVEATNTLSLDGPASDLLVGMNVKVAPGCTHVREGPGGCLDLHDNILNYGGQHMIPEKNPLGITNNFN